MRRTETGGPLELLVVDVDGDDDRCTCELRTGDGCVSDAATTEDGDAVAAADATGVDRGADPSHHAAAEQAGGGRARLGIDLGALAGSDQGLLGEGADAERRRQLGAVLECHLLGGVVGVEADLWLALAAAAARAAHSTPIEDDEVAGLDLAHTLADSFDDATGLVAEQERELVVDAALAVVQIGVADPACLDGDNSFPRARVGDDDVLDGHRSVLLHGDDALHGLRHGIPLWCSSPERSEARRRIVAGEGE